MAFSDNLSDLEHLINDAMGSAFEGARRVLAEQIHRRSESSLRDAREGGFRDLRDATARLDGAGTQAEVLTALLEESGRFASRTALLLTFADGARGWATYGFGQDTRGIEQLRLTYDADGLTRLAGGRGAVSLSAAECAGLADRFGGGAPHAGVLVPLVLRDRIAAALYADQLKATDTFVPAALQLLAYAAAHLLEGQGLRERASTPTLAGIDTAEVGGLPLWDQAAVEAAAAAPAAAPAQPVPAPRPAPPAPAVPAAVAAPEPVPAPPPEPAWKPEPEPEPPALAEAPLLEEPVAEEAAGEEAPAPWEEVPEEPAWAEPEAPPAEEPAWQMEEAAPAPAAAEPAAEEAWVYADQGYESAPAYEEGTEEVSAVAAYEETAEAGMEEVSAETVEEEPVAEEAAWEAPAVESPESVTSPLYGAPLYPSEATVRISRDLLQGAAPLHPPPPAVQPLAPPDVSEDRTVMLQRSSLAPQPAAPAPPPPAPPELEETHGRPAAPSRPAPVFGGGGGSTEVQPPPDLEGPGWAFRSGAEGATASYRQQTEENTALHDEARRLARLLVSEIKLYNEEQVEEGRRQRDIYPRLQEDIDRSRQMYEERVDPRVRDEVDYFQQEVVNILAGGDAGALGM